MNAHQRYIANLIAGMTPVEVAGLVAKPPGGKAAALNVKKIHRMVVTYFHQPTAEKWLDLLADAADPKHAEKGEKAWKVQWAAPIADLICDPELLKQIPGLVVLPELLDQIEEAPEEDDLPAPDEAEAEEGHGLREVA